jgi:phosphoribosylformylglycinamidine synthase
VPAPAPAELGRVLLRLLGSPNLCSREWVYEQYDQKVQSSTVIGPGGDAAVVRVPGTSRALALSTDCNPRYCAADPGLGAQHAVAEAARNVAVTGARPLAITNCLNFGSPERPEVMGEFVEAVRGMARACEAFEIPVVSGNVSFYNETAGHGAIPPTPTIGMVGLLEDAAHAVPAGFRGAGDAVLVAGTVAPVLDCTEYLAVVHGREEGPPPPLDLAAERALQELLAQAATTGLLRSAHDVAEGGLAIALAECALFGDVGCRATLPRAGELRADVLAFGEQAGCAILSCAPAQLEPLRALAARLGVPLCAVGETGGERLELAPGDIRLELAELRQAWRTPLAQALDS